VNGRNATTNSTQRHRIPWKDVKLVVKHVSDVLHFPLLTDEGLSQLLVADKEGVFGLEIAHFGARAEKLCDDAVLDLSLIDDDGAERGQKVGETDVETRQVREGDLSFQQDVVSDVQDDAIDVAAERRLCLLSKEEADVLVG